MMFGSPFGVVVFGAGIIVGYLLSENQRNNKEELDQAYDEMNNMLLEREGRIDELENYIDQLLDEREQSANKKTEKPPKPSEGKPDDLTRIEGIGPKTAEVLHNNGIHTYLTLSKTSKEALEQILVEAGSAYLGHGHETWAKQAILAANGNWDALETWQNS